MFHAFNIKECDDCIDPTSDDASRTKLIFQIDIIFETMEVQQ